MVESSIPDGQTRSWLQAEERGFELARRECRRLLRRARRRWGWTLAIPAALTAVLLLREHLRVIPNEASVTFQMVEARRSITAGSNPTSTGALRDYIFEGILTTGRCIEIVKRYGLYPSEMSIEPRMASQSLRDDIDIRVYRNTFIDEESRAPRSAFVKISYQAEGDVAFDVVNDLAAVVRAHEAAGRSSQAEEHHRAVAQALGAAREKLIKLQEEHTRLVALRMSGGQGALAARAKLPGAEEAITRVQWDIERLEQETNAAQLRLAAERQNMGLQFVQVDAKRITLAAATASKQLRMVVLGVVAFFVLLVLSCLGVGAFDARVYDLEDVARLGLSPVGHVPPFSGWEAGSFSERYRHALSRRKRPASPGGRAHG